MNVIWKWGSSWLPPNGKGSAYSLGENFFLTRTQSLFSWMHKSIGIGLYGTNNKSGSSSCRRESSWVGVSLTIALLWSYWIRQPIITDEEAHHDHILTIRNYEEQVIRPERPLLQPFLEKIIYFFLNFFFLPSLHRIHSQKKRRLAWGV